MPPPSAAQGIGSRSPPAVVAPTLDRSQPERSGALSGEAGLALLEEGHRGLDLVGAADERRHRGPLVEQLLGDRASARGVEPRSEELRVGKGCVRTWRIRGS